MGQDAEMLLCQIRSELVAVPEFLLRSLGHWDVRFRV